jgi:hypothetical protein
MNMLEARQRPLIPATLMSLLALILALACSNAEPTLSTPVDSEPSPADHSSFDRLLQTYVSDGGVDYKAWQQEQRDLAELDRYLSVLATTNLDGASRAELLAFYINGYNAATLRLIIRNLDQIESIKDIDSPWDTREWTLSGEVLTLNDIEHKKLREQLKEPRIHFAIVCASIGCPDLASRAYTAEAIEDQLDAAARQFMRQTKHLRTSETGRRPVLLLNPILNWFKDDFTAGGERPVSDFVVRYADPQTVTFITQHAERLKIDYLDYDWQLNLKRETE